MQLALPGGRKDLKRRTKIQEEGDEATRRTRIHEKGDEAGMRIRINGRLLPSTLDVGMIGHLGTKGIYPFPIPFFSKINVVQISLPITKRKLRTKRMVYCTYFLSASLLGKDINFSFAPHLHLLLGQQNH